MIMDGKSVTRSVYDEAKGMETNVLLFYANVTNDIYKVFGLECVEGNFEAFNSENKVLVSESAAVPLRCWANCAPVRGK